MATDYTSSVAAGVAIAPLVGLPASGNVPVALRAQCATVAQRHIPPGAPADWLTVCTASLIVRGIIYFKNVPGDCGSPTQIDLSQTNAAGAIGQSVIGIASMAGAQLPGIGIAISAIKQIFAAHAAAVANEQQTICKVAGIINQVFNYYDNLVKAGRISPSTAYAGMQSYLAQVSEQLATILKQCNAACVYSAILDAHADFVQFYYPAISPIQAVAHAPGAAPSSLGTVPGGVIQVGGAYQTAALPGAPSVSTNEILLVAVLIAALGIGWAVTK